MFIIQLTYLDLHALLFNNVVTHCWCLEFSADKIILAVGDPVSCIM